jgi:anaerobic selenocysteine-containing dehydrogenase
VAASKPKPGPTGVPPGMVFANFHFPGNQNSNELTIAALDPVAKIPEYKVCAVKVELA